jgi:hypothetical protein
MELTEIRPWQWAIVGAGLGCALAYSWSGVEAESGRSLSIEQFMYMVQQTSDVPQTQGMPVLNNIYVNPPEPGPSDGQVQQVTFGVLHQHNDQKQFAYLPFNATAVLPLTDQHPTIESYLQTVNQRLARRGSTQKVVWCMPLKSNPAMYYAAFAGSGAVALGVVWPVVLAVLTGAGMAPKPREKRQPGLGSYKPAPPEESTTPAKQAVTQKDIDELEALNAKLEASVRPGDQTATWMPASSSDAPAIRKLDGGPADAPSTPAKTEENKSYSGEWYPVVRPTNKPKDEP